MSDTPERPALPPQMALYQMAIGHYLSRALHLAAKLGVADLLKDGARRAEELAEATDTHAPSLRRVLRFLASVGVFEEREDGRLALTALAVAAAYDFTPFRTIVDVGGGNGALLLGILRATPRLEGIVFDRPDVVERAAKEIAASGLGDRCRAAGGDFFVEVPNGADAYVLKHVIHDWDDARARTILANCRRAMPRDGRLLLVEGV